MELSEVRVWAAERREELFVVLSVVLLVGLAGTVLVAAQSTTASDDFEEHSVGVVPDGWNNTSGPERFTVVDRSTGQLSGNRSLELPTPSNGIGTATWSAGPVLNVSDGFEVSMVFRHSDSNQADGVTGNVAFGIINNESGAGENVVTVLNAEDGRGMLGNNPATSSYSSGESGISQAFADDWEYVEMYSSGNGTVFVKIWNVGVVEPSSYTMRENFSAVSGRFVLWSGSGSPDREIAVDNITINGSDGTGAGGGGSGGVPQNESLTLDVRYYMQPNSTYPLSVYHHPDNFTRDEVTGSSTISIENVTYNGSQVLTYNSSANTVSTNSNLSVAEQLNITATYDTGNGTVNDTQNVVVAAPTVDNLQILPNGLIRTQAVLTDGTLQALLVAALLSVPAARFTNAFAGLAVAEVVVVIGWLAGYTSLGIAMLSVFMAMFVGLNLAANIDYAISRGT